MHRSRQLQHQLIKLRATLVIIYVPPICLLVALAIFSSVRGIELSILTQDPAAVFSHMIADLVAVAPEPFLELEQFKIPVYIGFVTKVGVLLWCIAATACFLIAHILARVPQRKANLQMMFFSQAGLISTLLLLDDFFMIHEKVMPVYFGISEKVLFSGYMLMVLAYLRRWLSKILATDYLILLLSFSFFGLSIAIDLIPNHKITFIEDAAKFLGIVGWCAYFVRTGIKELEFLTQPNIELIQPNRPENQAIPQANSGHVE
jgi:hypothetical protein